ncbi:hypothetical protein [Naasia sp. SYSU D00057]|uniref:hypothetical protein n=1 Tax=Naasia sp. SYSU D00057 TaxID=2817380 RepID=UPI001B30C35C|nr:hypothetical protein [Naasia sp. SYSU D00057]
MADSLDATPVAPGRQRATPSVPGPRRASSAAPGRRRAVSRHKRTRRVPTGRRALVELGLPALVLAALVAAIVALWSVPGERTGPLPAGVTLAGSIATVVLVLPVARLSGVGVPGAVLAAAFAALAPPAVAAARVGVPEHLAVVALLAAVLLLAIRYSPRVTLPIAALLAAAATALSPLALAAAPFLARQALTRLRRRHRIPTLPLAGAIYFAGTAAGWALLSLNSEAAPVAGAATAADWVTTFPAGAVAAVAALAFGLVDRSLRPLAGFALTVLVLSFWPDGDESTRLTVLLTPALAILVGAALDRILRWTRGRTLPTIAAVIAAALVVSSGAAASVAAAVTSENRSSEPAAPGPSSTTPAPTASPRATPAPGAAARAAVGAELAQNPRLALSPGARALLTDGAVDRRIPVVLAQLLSRHDVTVADFPAADGDDPSARRRVFVTQLDGEQLGTGGASMTALTSFLAALTGDFTVESVTVTGDGVLATFPTAPAD